MIYAQTHTYTYIVFINIYIYIYKFKYKHKYKYKCIYIYIYDIEFHLCPKTIWFSPPDNPFTHMTLRFYRWNLFSSFTLRALSGPPLASPVTAMLVLNTALGGARCPELHILLE